MTAALGDVDQSENLPIQICCVHESKDEDEVNNDRRMFEFQQIQIYGP